MYHLSGSNGALQYHRHGQKVGYEKVGPANAQN